MQDTPTSLPSEISSMVRDGLILLGDDFNREQLKLWYLQEQEAFYIDDSGNSDDDPWYAYMRHVNTLLGFAFVEKEPAPPRSVLILGPGSGKEIIEFAYKYPGCALNFLEASSNFQNELRKRFPDSNIVVPEYTGDINLPDSSQDVVCAFSVLHHMPNVSKVLAEVGRVMRSGGLLMVREPCSSMGIWGLPRSATPNERGISRSLMIESAKSAGFSCEYQPIPIIFEPINKILKKTIGFRFIPFSLLYRADRILSWILSFNDSYWRDTLLKKLGPSSYFYLFRRN